MATDTFLAMTAAEISGSSCLPPNIGWMACHFSPYSVGLSNRPTILPPNSLLILNDITPIHGHDKTVIAAQLAECAEAFKCRGVLLDFQRPDCTETAELASFLADVLPCPTVVSALYAGNLDCPVLIPPVPHHVPLADYLKHWQGRTLWMEMALDKEQIILTESGAEISILPADTAFEDGLCEDTLHCHYHIALSKDNAVFTLWRTKEDMEHLLAEAESLGVTTAVGLYQELGQ